MVEHLKEVLSVFYLINLSTCTFINVLQCGLTLCKQSCTVHQATVITIVVTKKMVLTCRVFMAKGSCLLYFISSVCTGIKICKGMIGDNADCELEHQWRRNGAHEKQLCRPSQHSDMTI